MQLKNQETNQSKIETSEVLRMLLVVLLVLLILINTTACTTGPVKKKNEIWLIDEKEMVLFRVISDNQEQAMPIKDNKSMKRFFCIDKDEVDYWLEGTGD